MNREIFREYDIRGNVEQELTDEVVSNIGRALATYMVERGKEPPPSAGTAGSVQNISGTSSLMR